MADLGQFSFFQEKKNDKKFPLRFGFPFHLDNESILSKWRLETKEENYQERDLGTGLLRSSSTAFTSRRQGELGWDEADLQHRPGPGGPGQ